MTIVESVDNRVKVHNIKFNNQAKYKSAYYKPHKIHALIYLQRQPIIYYYPIAFKTSLHSKISKYVLFDRLHHMVIFVYDYGDFRYGRECDEYNTRKRNKSAYHIANLLHVMGFELLTALSKRAYQIEETHNDYLPYFP